MQVEFIDLKKRFSEEKTELLKCIETVLEKGSFVLTKELEEFETAVSSYVGVKHALGVNSGTDALMMSLWALEIGRGDEVITSPISFVATAGAIAHVGAIPRFVDIGDDYNIDPHLIEDAVTERTRALMPVHWGGRLAKMHELMRVAEHHELPVIEDAAQAMGSFLGDRHAGSFGKLAAFSGHPLKNLNALGDAGFICTDDSNLYERLSIYRNHGLESRDSCIFFGVNSRLDSLHAKVLQFRLGRLQQLIDKRNENIRLYKELLKGLPVTFPVSAPDARTSSTMFLVRVAERDRLQSHLAASGIQSMIYYGTPLHLHKALAPFGYRRGMYPNAEQHCESVLALPHHQHLTVDQINYVGEVIQKFYGI
ncbi:MAG: DegT/DnrJ/EryC1/StrS family aminotransferase [Pseudomonadota bacterium]|nr:DegT/DnrJ/EryC1/StrS family aminotransferase [Pseudomonadota bacterium]